MKQIKRAGTRGAAGLLTVFSLACADGIAPPPSFELVDERQRLEASLVNAHTYGSFVLSFGGGLTAIRSGPANFPGNPPGGPGTCEDGLWINSRGKPTAGSLTHPHPHCTVSETAVTVVLEPISSQVHDPRLGCQEGAVCDFLLFNEVREGDLSVQARSGIKGNPGSTEGVGFVSAWAIDARTLNGANVRVGTLSFDLKQYTAPENLFGRCDMGSAEVPCLPLLITATYKPLAVGGVGTVQEVTGFLWWAAATAPYNY